MNYYGGRNAIVIGKVRLYYEGTQLVLSNALKIDIMNLKVVHQHKHIL